MTPPVDDSILTPKTRVALKRSWIILAAALSLFSPAGLLVSVHVALVGTAHPIATGFGTLFLLALALPIAATHSRIVAVVCAVVLNAYTLVAVAQPVGLGPAVASTAVLLAFSILLVAPLLFGRTPAPAGGIEHGERVLRRRGFAGGLLVIFSLAWIACPIWTTHLLALPQALIDVHPLFVLNGLIAPSDPWTHRPIAYSQLVRLGQDSMYVMPRSAWPCVVFHLLIALLLATPPALAAAARAHCARIEASSPPGVPTQASRP